MASPRPASGRPTHLHTDAPAASSGLPGALPSRRTATQRRRPVRPAAAGLLLLAFAGGLWLAACGQAPEPRKPPIVVVTIDTLRADHLGCYGYFRDTSPNLDRLAAESVFFRNAVTTMPTTLPAHVSLWTSRHPMQTGVTTNGRKLVFAREGEERLRLFAEMLRDAGYATAGFVSATPVKQATGISVGFDHFDEPVKDGTGRRGQANFTTDAVLEWLENPPPSPFFLWIHYFDPHTPYIPPPPYDTMFESGPEQIEYLYGQKMPVPDDPEILQANNLYDGEIRFVDTQLRRVFDALKARGLWEESLLVVVADHGQGLGQHGRDGHGDIYNEQIFIPLMMKFPASMGLNGREVEHLVSMVDVVPTIVDTLGLPLKPRDREQFVGVNALGPEPRRYALVQRSDHPTRRYNKDGFKYALVGLDWKFTYRTDGQEELFDMRTDRVETVSQTAIAAETAAALKDDLFTQIAKFAEASDGVEVVDETSPEIIEELKALGYLQ